MIRQLLKLHIEVSLILPITLIKENIRLNNIGNSCF